MLDIKNIDDFLSTDSYNLCKGFLFSKDNNLHNEKLSEEFWEISKKKSQYFINAGFKLKSSDYEIENVEEGGINSEYQSITQKIR